MPGAHDHPPEEPCPPACPGFPEVLRLLAVQRRHPEMLAACRAAAAVEWVAVAVEAPGVELPEHLREEVVVRLNLVVGRDTPELLLDEWGLRMNLTFRGRRHDCAIPWAAVLGGGLRPPPPPPRRRFGVIEGGKKD